MSEYSSDRGMALARDAVSQWDPASQWDPELECLLDRVMAWDDSWV